MEKMSEVMSMSSSSNYSPPHDPNIPSVAPAVTIGTLCAALGFLGIIVIIVYLLRRKLCMVGSIDEDNEYPVADPPPPTAFRGEVEGAVMVNADDRSFIQNHSVALTLVHSSNSSFAPCDVNKVDFTATEGISPTGNDTAGVYSPIHRSGSSLRPRYPKEIVDNSTNSVYKLYKRRSSALVYGTSTYNTVDNSMDMIAQHFGTVDNLEALRNEGEEVVRSNHVDPHGDIVPDVPAEGNTVNTAERGGNRAEGKGITEAVIQRNEKEEEEEGVFVVDQQQQEGEEEEERQPRHQEDDNEPFP